MDEKLKGCKIKFPDSIFFMNNRPGNKSEHLHLVMVKTDRDGCLSVNKQANKQTYHQLRLNLTKVCLGI
jgi:hypothetical protein